MLRVELASYDHEAVSLVISILQKHKQEMSKYRSSETIHPGKLQF